MLGSIVGFFRRKRAYRPPSAAGRNFHHGDIMSTRLHELIEDHGELFYINKRIELVAKAVVQNNKNNIEQVEQCRC